MLPLNLNFFFSSLRLDATPVRHLALGLPEASAISAGLNCDPKKEFEEYSRRYPGAREPVMLRGGDGANLGFVF
jgi:hypothetical protein